MSKVSGSRVQRITSSDVARFVGVSQATVSRAYSPHSSMTETTRAKILEAAKRLNYVPNSFARSLITRTSEIIAVLIGDMHNPFYTAALGEISMRLQAVGKQVLLFNATHLDDGDDAIRRMLEYQVDGLLITAASISMQVSALCDDRGIPVVMFNRYVPGFRANSVCCDNLAGGRLAASTLFAAGARRYAMIYGDHSTTTTIERMQGFTEFLAEQGISEIAKSCGHYTYEGGYAAATSLIASNQRPDALFCANDIMALGAIDAVRAAGRRVPDDLMIIGFDDIDEAARPPYRLTTIRQPIDQMVDAAMALLTGPSREPVAHRVPGRLIERATTRPRQSEDGRIPS